MTPSADAAAGRYLHLLKQTLTRALFGGGLVGYEPAADAPERALWEVFCDVTPVDVALVQREPADPAARAEGRDRPADAETMIGLLRLDNLQQCVTSVLREGIPGDLLEAGVWRGGATILMRGVLAAYGITDRCVWVADSFQGLPPPDPERYPADAGDRHWAHPELAESLDDVRANFERYGLLDDQVRFLPGWFEDTLPSAPVEALAVLRVDGDMYGSTMVTLQSLYPKVADGGFVIVDDYGAVRGCQAAVKDFRSEHGITAELTRIDWTGVYWRKHGPPASASAASTVTAEAAGSTGGVIVPSEQPASGRTGRYLTVEVGGAPHTVDLYSERGFAVAADLYTRAGWHQEIYQRTSWLGVPVLQIPEDLVALQTLVWQVRPDVIVETGVMHGGSAIFHASLLELLGHGRVLAVDLHLTDEARARVAGHRVGHRVTLIEGSSTDGQVLARVRDGIRSGDRVLVVLDADHSYDHVLAELESYAGLVSPGSYVVVCDGVMAALTDAPAGAANWAWDNPARAADDFLASHPEFRRDPRYGSAGATYFPHGFLQRSEEDHSPSAGTA